MTETNFDVLVFGSGLAGLSAALLLAPTHRVAVLTKGELAEGASGWAQGGIAAVLAEDDSFGAHVDDTLVAGAGLCDAAATRQVVEGAPGAIAWLQSLGVPFSLENGGLHLTREGGHSARRIVHAADATGAAVQRTLLARVRATPGIALFEQHVLVELVRQPTATGQARCLGAQVLDARDGTVHIFTAAHTLLATGGAGQVYLHTTNPATATGDGIAAAWRAGCRVSNLEFIQFHPTSLHHPQSHGYLISEAVRGEGGHLLLADGTRFMPAHDARAELAPRDIVARAIDAEMKASGADCVYLDISHRPPEFLHEHFPNILARCGELGIDITREPIPVVPAAHYTCGGVLTDLDGRTDMPGLYAIGETACTGLHGANRLASNSLVECIVFARAAVAAIRGAAPVDIAGAAGPSLPPVAGGHPQQAGDAALIASQREALGRLMWDYVGIVRSDERLDHAAAQIAQLAAEVQAAHGVSAPGRALLELRSLLEVASLVVRSARARRESRGLHFSRDCPQCWPSSQPADSQRAYLSYRRDR